MTVPDLHEEIASLESRLVHFEYLLEESIRNNEVMGKTKVILHEVKKIAKKLKELKRLNEIKQPGDG